MIVAMRSGAGFSVLAAFLMAWMSSGGLYGQDASDYDYDYDYYSSDDEDNYYNSVLGDYPYDDGEYDSGNEDASSSPDNQTNSQVENETENPQADQSQRASEQNTRESVSQSDENIPSFDDAAIEGHTPNYSNYIDESNYSQLRDELANPFGDQEFGLAEPGENQNLDSGGENPVVNELSASSIMSEDQIRGSAMVSIDSVSLPPEVASIEPIVNTLGILNPGEAPHHYVIQEGDTLFDICDQLLDEPAYWPKLWSLNPEIKNPHFIWPGMVLRFYPGDDFLPPFLEIRNEQNLDPVAMDGDFVAEDLVQAPLETEEVKPTFVQDLFPEFMTDQEIANLRSFPTEETGMYRGGSEVVMPFFVFKKKVKPIGTIIGSSLDDYTIDHLGVLLATDALSAGKVYTVVRKSHVIKDPHKQRFVGHQYINVGEVRVVEVYDKRLRRAIRSYYGDILNVSMLKHRPQKAALYQVHRLLSVMRKGDLVVEKIPATFTIPPEPQKVASRDVDASVVSFFGNLQTMSQSKEFVVLNSTSLQPGDEISLYKERRILDNLMGIGQYYASGVVRVVSVSKAASIAYILEAEKAVMIGDRCEPQPP